MTIIQSPTSNSLFNLNQRTFECQQGLIIGNGTFQPASGQLYAVYIGKLNYAQAFAFVRFYISTAGVGTQTAEVGLLSSPAAPNRSFQTLTGLVGGSVGSLTATGSNANSSTFSGTTVAGGTHVWAGVRVVMGTTQPTFSGGYSEDLAQLSVLALGSSPAIAASSTYVMNTSFNQAAGVNISPRLVVTLD